MAATVNFCTALETVTSLAKSDEQTGGHRHGQPLQHPYRRCHVWESREAEWQRVRLAEVMETRR